jgi:Ca-activated chloride channel family protein
VIFIAFVTILFLRSYKKRENLIKQFNLFNLEEKINSANKKYQRNYLILFVISVAIFGLTNFLLATSFSIFDDFDNNIQENGNEIVFLLDISNSMNAIDEIDFENEKINENFAESRLKKAKNCINYLIDNLENSDFGLVIFAGESQILAPISQDKYFINQLVTELNSNFISNQGTNIELGIEKAIECFSNFNENKNLKQKNIIILTDAENHNGNIDEAILLAKSLNIKIISIGFGSENGSLIPTENNLFLQDLNGKNVISSLNQEILAKISQDFFIYPFDFNELIEKIDLKNVDFDYKKNILEINSLENNLNFSTISLLIILILLFISFYLKNN